MINKTFLFSILVLLATSCSGTRANNTDSKDESVNLKLYNSPLDYAVRFMSGALEELPDELYGIYNLQNSFDEDGEETIRSWSEVRAMVGYTFIDLDGNGTDELLITERGNNPGEQERGSLIYALYHLVNGEPTPLLGTGGRNAWYLTDQNELVNLASENAACNISAVYDFVDNQLKCKDYWFTGISSDGDPLFYHSKEATIDPSKAELLSWNFDDLNQNDAALLSRTRLIESKPFTNFRPLTVRQEGTKMHFTTSAELKNFKVLALSNPQLMDIVMTFTEKVMQERPSLKPGEDFVVDMPLHGDLPEYGISYIDPLGKRVKVTVEISGEDGSIVMNSYGGYDEEEVANNNTAATDSQENTSVQNGYTPILEEIVEYLAGHQTGEAKGFDAIDGVLSELSILNPDEPAPIEQVRALIGYCFRDLDNDGTPELLIGKTKPYIDYKGRQFGTSLLVLYKMKDGKPTLLTHGLEFCLWYLTNQNQLLQQRLIAGFNENTCLFNFRNNEMQCRDRWYTDDNESFYHASSYSDKGTRLDWTDDDFMRNDEKLLKQTIVLPLTPFTHLRPVTVRQEGDTKYFSTTAEVKDFKVLALSDVNYENDGLNYKEKVVHSYPTLKPGEEIKAQMSTGSTMPQHAISYTDPLGYTVKMEVTESGIDGSVVLVPLN